MPDVRFSNQYPYTDFHELNLDWVIKEVKFWSERVGKSIQSITLTGTVGLVDTYTITYSDGTTSTFDVTNGNGIVSVAKTGTAGLVDTYTITLTDGSMSTFEVHNGTASIDSTLTLSGYAADAKATGDRFDTDESFLFDFSQETTETTDSPTMNSGLCKADGSITASSNYEYSDIIPVIPGDIITGQATVKPGQTAPSQPCYIRYWTAYDENNVVVAAAGDNSGTISTYTVPSNIYGIRVTLNLVLYESGSLIIHNQRTVDIQELKNDIQITENKIVDVVTDTVIGKNLINKALAETGAVIADGTISTTGSYANYKVSDYIAVNSGTTYTLYLGDYAGLSSSTTRLIYCLYNSAKVKQTHVNQNGVSYLTFTPTVDGFIRVSCVDTPTTYFTDNLMLISGNDFIPFINYAETQILIDDINPVNKNFRGSVLLGKKWVPCGDSFTQYTNAQFTTGIYAGYNKTYPFLIALRNNMKLETAFFMSGRTMAYPADGTFTNSLTCPSSPGYYQNIPADVDYITIMLGINDSQHTSGSGQIPLGTITDSSTSTYYGAYNTVLSWIRTNRPFAHVGIIVTNGTERQNYTDAQIALAKKWGYPIINLNGDERTPVMIRPYNTDISIALKDLIKQEMAIDFDGSQTGTVDLHPNYQAHAYESTFIENWLMSL